jgi:hydrogenase-4 membrane subunit HyfE
MPSLSYQEKSLYGALAANLAVFVPYFVLIHKDTHPSLNLIAGAITVLIIAQIILQTIIAIASRNRMTDERDRLILLRGYRAGYFTVVSVMLLGMAMLWVHASLGQINPAHMALHFLSVFFAVLMLAEVVKTITQLIAYRRPL